MSYVSAHTLQAHRLQRTTGVAVNQSSLRDFCNTLVCAIPGVENAGLGSHRPFGTWRRLRIVSPPPISEETRIPSPTFAAVRGLSFSGESLLIVCFSRCAKSAYCVVLIST